MFQTAEMERLKTSNSRLVATVQELQLELSFYQGEMKRLSFEKQLLSKDMQQMTELSQRWMNSFKNGQSRSLSEHCGSSSETNNPTTDPNTSMTTPSTCLLKDQKYLAAIINYPCRSVCDAISLHDSNLLVTSCQEPYFIEVSQVVSSFCLPI